jgi:hypothetical protein
VYYDTFHGLPSQSFNGSDFAGHGCGAYLRYCRKGLTAPPSTDVFDIKDLRPEALHTVIKTAQLLADLGDTLALLCPVPFALTEKLQLLWGWFKPQSGELQNHIILPLCNRCDTTKVC